MVKKRLSDLLREEVQKSGEAASEPTDEQQSSEQQSGEQQSNDQQDQQNEETIAPVAEESDGKVAPGEAKPVASEASTASEEPAHSRKNSPTKAELETLVAELKSALETSRQTAQQQEDELKQQITKLQAEIENQQGMLEKLQTEVKQAQSLKKELEEAKQMILQLSQTNAKPASAAPASTPAPTAASSSRQPIALSPMKPLPAQSAEPELEASRIKLDRPSGLSDTGKLSSEQTPKYQQELRRILDHPVRPGIVPSMPSDDLKEKGKDQEKKLSDTDMGWVD